MAALESIFLVGISALIAFILRKLFFNRVFFCFLYYLCLLIPLLFWIAIGGSIANDAYERLCVFQKIEESGNLQAAKSNLNNYDNMLAIDLQQFSNSVDFREYIYNSYEKNFEKHKAIVFGLFFAILCELSAALV